MLLKLIIIKIDHTKKKKKTQMTQFKKTYLTALTVAELTLTLVYFLVTTLFA